MTLSPLLKIFMQKLNRHKILTKHLQKCENPWGLKPLNILWGSSLTLCSIQNRILHSLFGGVCLAHNASFPIVVENLSHKWYNVFWTSHVLILDQKNILSIYLCRNGKKNIFGKNRKGDGTLTEPILTKCGNWMIFSVGHTMWWFKRHVFSRLTSSEGGVILSLP